MKLTKATMHPKPPTFYTSTDGWSYSTFYDVGNKVIYTPQNILCDVIEKHYKRYKLRHSKYQGIEFMADEHQIKSYIPKDPPAYLTEDNNE